MILAILLITGFCLRLATALFYGQYHQLPDYFSQYHPAIMNFINGLGFTNTKPVGNILHMVPFALIFKTDYVIPALIGQAFTGTLLIYILYRLSLQLFKNNTAALITAAMASIYPWLLYYSGQLSPEHWFTFWLVLSIYGLIRLSPQTTWQEALITGLILGCTAAVRSIFVAYIILVIVYLFVFRQIRWQQLGVIVTGVMLIILSWTTYNYLHNNKLSFTGGNADHNLYLGLNPYNKTGGAIWGEDAPSFAEIDRIMATLPPEKAKTYFKDEALRFVKEQPGQVLALVPKKMFIFWRPYPRAPEYTNIWTILIIAGSFIPILLFALYGTVLMFREPQHRIALGVIWLYIAQLNGLHLIFPASLVYRFPIEPLLILLAGYGSATILKKKN